MTWISDQARPWGPGAQGGWGGPHFVGYGLKNCALAANKLSIPIIAGLGVWDWRDIIKYTMVGASLVQSGVGIMLQGNDVAKKWERAHQPVAGCPRLQLSGRYPRHRPAQRPEDRSGGARARGRVRARWTTTSAPKCGVCKRSCFYDAITLTKCGAVIDQHKCDGCGMCMEVCPANAVSMTSPRSGRINVALTRRSCK